MFWWCRLGKGSKLNPGEEKSLRVAGILSYPVAEFSPVCLFVTTLGRLPPLKIDNEMFL
jgi:hypothetical protein